MDVTVTVSERRWKSLIPLITKCFAVFEKVVVLPSSSVDVFLVSLKEARQIKAESVRRGLRVSGKSDKHSFNVLAYPAPRNFPRPDRRGKFLGEIYLSPDFVEAHGQNVASMLAHGFLHLLGYDHEKKNDRIRMAAQEKKLLRRLTSKFCVVRNGVSKTSEDKHKTRRKVTT